MATTKSNIVLASAGLLISALLLPAGSAEGRPETPQASREPAMRAMPATIAGRPGAEPDAVRTQLERLAEHELKSVYRRCSDEALANRLANGEIAMCSVAYDVLLKQHFDGEFEALLAWSRGS